LSDAIHDWLVEYTKRTEPMLPPMTGPIADKSKGEIGIRDFLESLSYANQPQAIDSTANPSRTRL
jgi:hypothetical protein